MARSTISIPIVSEEGLRPLIGKSEKIEISEISKDISAVIEAIGTESLNDRQHALLRAYIYAHYHPELKIGLRVRIYQAVKEALEDENLNQLKGIAGIKQKSAYINAITNVGKRSSYFGGLIGITVAGHFFLPPIVKFGILPVARRTFRKLIPKQIHLTPIGKSFKLSSLVWKNPATIYSGIRRALGTPTIARSGKPLTSGIDTTPMDDLIGNLFFRSLIAQSSFNLAAKDDFRERAKIAFIYDMARVSRQLEGLARSPDRTWERISHYTNFAMFLKSVESNEVPIQGMLHDAVETISRANIGSKPSDRRFYAEFERGLKNLNYILKVVEPLDRFNEKDAFDDMESQEAKLAFFTQNRLVMERLYYEHEREVAKINPMFLNFQKAALESKPDGVDSGAEQYKRFQSKVRGIISSYRRPFRELGYAELKSYNQELQRLGGR